jgi:hypothetical protein
MLRKLSLALAFVAALCVTSISGTQKWTAGAYTSYSTTLCSTELNSMPNGAATLCGTVITAGDLYATLSFTISTTTAASSGPFLQAYAYPLNEDGSTYGDGQWTATGASSTAGVPVATYQTNCVLQVSGSGGWKGTCGPFAVPPVNYKIVIANQLNTTASSTALGSSANNIYINTWNLAD